jgi:hypothetical protein
MMDNHGVLGSSANHRSEDGSRYEHKLGTGKGQSLKAGSQDQHQPRKDRNQEMFTAMNAIQERMEAVIMSSHKEAKATVMVGQEKMEVTISSTQSRLEKIIKN